MKKIIVTIITVFLFAFTHAADKVEKQVEHSFQSEFPRATHASWLKIDNSDLYAVRFVYNNEARMAYYDTDGSRLAIVKSIQEDQLPLQVRKAMNSIVSNEDMPTIVEINMLGETSYLFQFQDEGSIKSYHVIKNGSSKEIKLKEILIQK
jgi:hypothetical protein